ncbi:hypothetical protein [Halapricum desulfuricans]|uniref:Lipoprotein n=1 Tax=Halapricum desulfuricans TaxID=2841257 RepID=A0A897NBW6_9EURY|nr:hypothetical protein [Halapricum desulfuricans]QSG10132.1 Uncharacterized protein HSR122_2758 [Halapricum desulfuricans]QSG10773.1 Uncharacterized protein HSBGL_0336 [Halapricum desulfuricans]
MKRRYFLAGTASVAALLAGCSGDDEPSDDDPTDTSTPSDELVDGSFEYGLERWYVDTDLPDEPGNPGQKVDASVTTADRASDGQQGIEIFIDGSADDGTVWVQQEVDLSEVSTLKVDGYSEQNSFTTVLQVATYTGPVPEDGLVETDFNRDHSLWDHEGWKTYEYDVDHDGTGLVAVGFSIIWETGAAGVLDNVQLE